MHEIRTERLLLRKARESDLDAIHSLLSDAQATTYWYEPPHSTVDQSREWLAAMIKVPQPAGDDFIVEHEGRVIGKAGFRAFPVIGFIFRPDSWVGVSRARRSLPSFSELSTCTSSPPSRRMSIRETNDVCACCEAWISARSAVRNEPGMSAVSGATASICAFRAPRTIPGRRAHSAVRQTRKLEQAPKWISA